MGIYLSVPFCRSKCPYCNFASGVFSGIDRQRYVDRLLAEIQNAGSWALRQGVVLPRAVDSLYLGGGTPTILEPAQLEKIFAALGLAFDFVPDVETTVECAPGSLSDATLDGLVQAGCNRVSLGVQSFVDREAAWSGRRHTRAGVEDDLRRLRRAGIENITLDLIAGLPGQTLASWDESLETLVATGVPHASVYMFEVDEDSRLGREMLAGGARFHAAETPSEELVAEMYLRAIERLGAAGLAQYEISNFARPGWESRHNLRYWRRQPYLGLGLDASSMLRASGGDQVGSVLRTSTTDQMPAWLDGADPVEVEWLDASRQHEEAWFLGLRTNQGVDLDALEREFGAARLAPARRKLPDLLEAGLIECAASQVKLTARGRLLANEVFQEFLELEAAN